ncbi:MAG: ATP-binding protein [Methylococcaceae bacterium]
MQIVNSYLALNALRQVGYRSTATAIAELVDNSIEAKANDVSIITFSKMEKGAKRATYRVQKIAVLDNGEGMTMEELSNCLSLGWGSRLDSREGLGRFGFGLKGASISQCRCIEVISWRDENCSSTYMDLDEIRDGDLQKLNPTKKIELPKYVIDAFGDSYKDSGTMIIWSKLDGVDFTRPATLLRRMDSELCRIYRHFLDDDDTYGRRRNVVMYDFDLDKNKIKNASPLQPNDPLYLLTPSNVPGADGKNTNVSYEKPYSIPIEYAPGKISDVEIRLSIAMPETQTLGGNSVLGKHYASNTGISFVRAGREIDFNTFGYVNPSEPRNRWWGAEVRFKPELDELFGVTNNKQHIRGFKRLDHRFDQDLITALKEASEDEDSAGHYKSKLMLNLHYNLEEKIKAMMLIITKRKEGAKSPAGAAKPDKIIDEVNTDISEDHTATSSDAAADAKSENEKLEERKDLLSETRPDLTDKELERLAKETLDYKVDLSKGDWAGNTFLDIKLVANAAVGVINTRSDYYKKFWQHLEDHDDAMGISALEIFTMAYVRTEDEFRRKHGAELFEEFRDRWGTWVNTLLKHVGE